MAHSGLHNACTHVRCAQLLLWDSRHSELCEWWMCTNLQPQSWLAWPGCCHTFRTMMSHSTDPCLVQCTTPQLTKEDYAWPTLSPKLVGFAKEVSQGRGFQLFKGFPVQHYKGDRLGLVLAYWGVALHIGR